jgi:hypothetical protein
MTLSLCAHLSREAGGFVKDYLAFAQFFIGNETLQKYFCLAFFSGRENFRSTCSVRNYFWPQDLIIRSSNRNFLKPKSVCMRRGGPGLSFVWRTRNRIGTGAVAASPEPGEEQPV